MERTCSSAIRRCGQSVRSTRRMPHSSRDPIEHDISTKPVGNPGGRPAILKNLQTLAREAEEAIDALVTALKHHATRVSAAICGRLERLADAIAGSVMLRWLA
jgi:hypothetical protein